jgi:putative transposase
LDRKHIIRARGYSFDWLIDRVTVLFGMSFEEILMGGKRRKAVTARSVLCFWGTRELGISAVWISKKMNTAFSTASETVLFRATLIHRPELQLSCISNQ